jgi:hypothetical protein
MRKEAGMLIFMHKNCAMRQNSPYCSLVGVHTVQYPVPHSAVKLATLFAAILQYVNKKLLFLILMKNMLNFIV